MIHIPCKDRVIARQQQPNRHRALPGRPHPIRQPSNVLVVDDDSAIRDFLSLALEDEGYSVQTATNGQEALDKVRRNPPDAILLDLMMPIMDGWCFLNARRTLPVECRCPVLAMSAAGGSHMAGALGATSFLAKPFDLDALLRKLARVIDA